MLSLLLNPKCALPTDSKTGKPIRNARLKAEYAFKRIIKQKERIVIPTPAVAELLTAIGHDAQRYFDMIMKSRQISVEAFDQKCAIELALLNRTTFQSHDKRNRTETHQKVKLDRQIIAILAANGAKAMYTDDRPLANRAKLCGIQPVMAADLPEPHDDDGQMLIDFERVEPLPAVPPDEFPDVADGRPHG